MASDSDFQPNILLSTYSKYIDGRHFVDVRLLEALGSKTIDKKKLFMDNTLSVLLPGTFLQPSDVVRKHGKNILVAVSAGILIL
jgi:hypothetical protein